MESLVPPVLPFRVRIARQQQLRYVQCSSEVRGLQGSQAPQTMSPCMNPPNRQHPPQILRARFGSSVAQSPQKISSGSKCDVMYRTKCTAPNPQISERKVNPCGGM